MAQEKILILEDEVLIADHISLFLRKRDYQIAGIALSYAEAQQLYQSEKVDIALIDIRLNGPETGIDFAHYLRQQPHLIPFIYLTSQYDQKNLAAAKETYPAGYLTKPINMQSLYASLEMALHRFQTIKGSTETGGQVKLFDGYQYYRVSPSEIKYVEVDHIYVNVHLKSGETILQRSSLAELATQLPAEKFVRTHRRYLVNRAAISHWNSEYVYLGSKPILISKRRRKEVWALLE